MHRVAWIGSTRRAGTLLDLGGLRFLRIRLRLGGMASSCASGFRLRLALDLALEGLTVDGRALGGVALGPQRFYVADRRR